MTAATHARAHGAIHVEVGALDGLTTDFDDGSVGFTLTRLPLSVWLVGTPDELADFAADIARHVRRARRLVRPPSPDVPDDPVVIPREDVADWIRPYLERIDADPEAARQLVRPEDVA